MDAAEAHQQLTRATGGQPPRAHHLAARPVEERLAELPVASRAAHLQTGVNAIASALGIAHDALEEFVVVALKLVETAEEVSDDDGREVWLTAGEVELDQWTQRLLDAAAAVRHQLGRQAQ